MSFNPEQDTMFPVRSFTKQVVATNPDQQPAPKTETKEAGMDRADLNADEAWRKRANEVLHQICLTMPVFTSDDIEIEMAKYPERTHDKRALGSRLIYGAKMRWCEKTDVHRNSIRPEAHKNPKRVWHSILYPLTHG